jgi:23S rRNA pseudouridine1911/1915/1917 synthase
MDMQEFEAQEADAGLRADVFVAGKYPEFSRSSLEGLFSSGKITLRSQTLKPSHKIRTGEKLTVDETLLRQDPPVIKLPIIYEDKDVLVINKPAGVLSHSKGALNNEATVASFIKPGLSKDISATNRAGIVHRLDRRTSGVMITAKNQAALSWLQKQFSAKRTKKTYVAVAEGIPEPQEAIIDAPIARNPKKPQTFHVNAGGKPSQTKYKVLEQFKKNGKNYSLLELQPQTGRTHQLRVHLAYVNHPVAGDDVYGHSGPNLMLHAKSLEVTLPNRQRQVFSAPAPGYFKEFKNE